MCADRANRPLGYARGFPIGTEGLSVTDIAAQDWTVPHDFSTPIAVLDGDALDHNAARMARWCADHGVELMPHGKTTMAPTLFALQLAHGATGLTAATPAQARFMFASGIRAVQLANQFVQPADARHIAELLARDAGLAFTCWVDSPQGVDILQAAGREAGVTFDVLLEVGAPGGRSGCRTDQARAAVVATVQDATHVRLAGVAGWEGAYASARDDQSLARVRSFLRSVRAAAEELRAEGAAGTDAPIVLTAGGSMFFDLVAEELGSGWAPGTARVVLRSGCYLAHDHEHYRQNSPLDGSGVDDPLRPALSVWGTVLSRPEPELVLVDAGRRDISFDAGLPVPLAHLAAEGSVPELLADVRVTALNDQHAFLDVPADHTLAVGDRVQLGISHPCTTFDKWRAIPVVREGAVTDVVHTYF